MTDPATAPLVRMASTHDIERLGSIWLEFMEMHEGSDPRFALAPDALARWKSLATEMIEREDTFVLAASLAGRAVGFCVGWVARNPAIYRVPEVGFISEIAVLRSAQRRGVGRALMRGARDWFRARGLPEFQLSTAVWNEGAQAFWRSLGGEPFLVRFRFESDSAFAQPTLKP